MSRPLFKLSALLKHQLNLPKRIIGSKYSYSTSESEPIKNEIKFTISSSKELLEKLKIIDNPSNLIANIEANKEKLDGSHIVTALTTMLKYYQMNQIHLDDIQKNTDFLTICYMLNKNLLRLDTSEALQALKILNLFQVPSSTVIVQSLLQLIRNSINDLNLDQIYFLSFLLKNLDSTCLSDAIYTALPEIFKAQLELKLDQEDTKELKNALRFASIYVNDQRITVFILDALLKMTITDIDTAKEVLIAMCKIKDIQNDYFIIIRNVQDTVTKYLSLLKLLEVISILSNVLKKSIKGDDKFYNPFFIDKLIDKMIHDGCEFDSGIYILNKLNRLKHIRIPLLNYLASKLYEDPTIARKCQPQNLVTFVSAFSYANHTPENWVEIQQILVSNYDRLPNHVPLCFYTFHLASLDCFNSKLIEKIFIADKNPDLLTTSYFKTIKKLYQSVKTLYPAYSGPWPIKELVESFRTNLIDESKFYPLRHVVENFFGGAEYVNTNVRTNLGHDIDHLIVVQNGSPIIVQNTNKDDSNSISYVDDFNIPSDSERIAVLILPPELYGKNIKILEAPTLLYIKSLEAMSFRVVPISFSDFIQMPDNEIHPYLQNLFMLKNKEKVSQVN